MLAGFVPVKARLVIETPRDTTRLTNVVVVFGLVQVKTMSPILSAMPFPRTTGGAATEAWQSIVA